MTHQYTLYERLKETSKEYVQFVVFCFFFFSRQFAFIPIITKQQGFSKKSDAPSLLLCQLADLWQEGSALLKTVQQKSAEV